ncbi:hypothetical protein JCM8097_005506 [Rhodosporidiobolus ruineniae]
MILNRPSLPPPSSSKGIRHVSAFVLFDDEEVESIGDVDKGDLYFTYCEAVDGAKVKVGWVDQRTVPPAEPFVVRLLVDGNFVNGKVFEPNDTIYKLHRDDPRRTLFFTGQLAGENSMRPIHLMKCEYTEALDQAMARTEAFGLGKIQLTYHRIHNLHWVQGTSTNKLDAKVLPKTWIKDQEGRPPLLVTHQAVSGESINVAPQPWRRYDYVDPKDDPFLTFEWRPLSHNMLQAIGFLPPDPEPASTPTPRGRSFTVPSSETPSTFSANQRRMKPAEKAARQSELDAKVKAAQCHLDRLTNSGTPGIGEPRPHYPAGLGMGKSAGALAGAGMAGGGAGGTGHGAQRAKKRALSTVDEIVLGSSDEDEEELSVGGSVEF